MPPTADNTLFIAQMIVALRRNLAKWVPAEIVGDVGLELLLQTYIADGRGESVCPAELARRGHCTVPQMQRWLTLLERKGLLHRRGEAIAMTPEGVSALEGHFRDVAALIDVSPAGADGSG